MIIGCIATRRGREASLLVTLKSIRPYVDKIYVHVNGRCNLTEHKKYIDYLTYHTVNLADNGKFLALTKWHDKSVYYLTFDDDLWYDTDYVPNTIKAIDEEKCIVTYHGRKLLGLNRNYYRGHFAVRCLDESNVHCELDVAGTGVLGFHTDYFYPEIWDSPDLIMNDLVFSLEAAKQGKKIMVLPHREGLIKQIAEDAGICGYFAKHPITRQNEIANEIWNIKHEKISVNQQSNT